LDCEFTLYFIDTKNGFWMIHRATENTGDENEFLYLSS